MATIIRVPDANPITAPRDGMTVEEARRACIQLGLTQVETANGRIAGNEIIFERAVGGEKG